MVKYAILLASKEWCEAASSGRIKVYDFKKKRKRGIRALTPNSVCIVMTRAEADQPPIIYGEFTVAEVKEVDANEYNRLASEGLIHDPLTLRPNEKRWVILFNEFREYKKKIPKEALTDVKTRNSKNPISEWVIMGGLTYIDEQAFEGIKRKVGDFTEEGSV